MRELILFFIAFVLASYNASAQYRQSMESNRIKYQQCLDAGENMLGCSERYYNQTDSLLNAVYRRIIQKYESKKTIIKSDQLKWLRARDRSFKQIDRFVDADLGSYDNQMVRTDKKAVLVEKRVNQLLELYPVN